MKKFLAVLTLLILSFPVVAANYEMLRENVAAVANDAQNSSWKKIQTNGRTFIFDSAAVEYGKKYELKYKAADLPSSGEDTVVLYVRYYPNVDKLEKHWITDENVLEKESANGEEPQVLSAELGNKSSSATKQVLRSEEMLAGMVDIQYSDSRVTSVTQLDDKQKFLENLIAVVDLVQIPTLDEIKDRTLGQMEIQARSAKN